MLGPMESQSKKSTCRVVWSEILEDKLPPSFVLESSDFPPKKRRRLEMLASDLEMGSLMAEVTTGQCCDLEPIRPNQSFCLGVATGAWCPGAEATVVGFWRKDSAEVAVQTGELTRVQLTTRSVCSGELSIDEHCLSLWNGESSPPHLHLLLMRFCFPDRNLDFTWREVS